jgi:hypothetical protein
MPESLIDREMTLPAILSRYPSCRKVFDRYGLLGCGGPLGREEKLEFFARAHRVDEAHLIAELEQAARDPQPSSPEYNPGSADTIYRRFFKAGIATMFTFGCVLGGINLAIMAARHELASLDMRAITWAHAHAQVAGWVTFFVMGFAYQAIPRFKFTALWRPRLAVWSLPVMATALTLRTLADIWVSNPFWRVIGRVAGAAELAVIIVFACVIARTIWQSTQPSEPYEKFLFAALTWMVAAFGFDLWIFTESGTITGYKSWVQFIGLWDAPWRDAQLLGFAGGMILGVSQRFLPFIYGFREIPARTSRLVFYLWNLSVALNIAAYSMLIRTRRPLWGIALELSIFGLLAAVGALVYGFRLFSVRVETDRSLPFLRAAFGWALVALALFALLPVYTAARHVVFSHAYFGGYRHAFTVGFISMMIVGVSSKIVPVLGGLDQRQVRSLRLAFWLLNIGNAMRVLFQILTDTQPWAFPVMAVSAWVEVTGLAIWAIDLWRSMNRTPQHWSLPTQVCVTAQTKVAEVIDRYPQTRPAFLQFGFTMIDNPVARQFLARSVSIGQACRLKHVDCEEFLRALKAHTLESDNRSAEARLDSLVQLSVKTN